MSRDKMKEHQAPSWFYEGGYKELSKCIECSNLAFYLDECRFEPCRKCGGKMHNKFLVGIWISKRKWYQKLYMSDYGYWRLKPEVK